MHYIQNCASSWKYARTLQAKIQQHLLSMQVTHIAHMLLSTGARDHKLHKTGNARLQARHTFPQQVLHWVGFPNITTAVCVGNKAHHSRP